MRLGVVGYRKFNNYECFKKKMDALFLYCDIEEIITGNEPGVDQLAVRYASENKIPISICDNYRVEGFLKNISVIEGCDQLIAFLSSKSKGTAESIKKATSLDKEVFVFNI